MAGNRSNQDYGAVFVDERVLRNPTSQCPANKYNRKAEDVAQMTRTSTKVRVKFQTTTTAGPVAVAVVSCKTQWGTGGAYHPSISKTATGTYVATWPTEFDDGLVGTSADDVAETETLALEFADGVPMANSDADVRCTASANVVTVYVRTGGALSDLGGGVTIYFKAA